MTDTPEGTRFCWRGPQGQGFRWRRRFSVTSEGWTRAGSRGTKPFCVRPRTRGFERRRWGRLIRILEFSGSYCD
eukprot:787523-Rhodomonas_salina.1